MAKRDELTLKGRISTLLADNTDGDISAADLRGVLVDLVDSLSSAFDPIFTNRNSDYILTAGDQNHFITAYGSNDLEFTLPDIPGGSVEIGWSVYFLNISSGTLTISTDGADTIDGAATREVPAGEAIRVVATSRATWAVIVDTEKGAAGTTLTDDALLDLAKETRTTADRGKVIGTKDDNENEVELRDAPSANDSVARAAAAAAQSTADSAETEAQANTQQIESALQTANNAVADAMIARRAAERAQAVADELEPKGADIDVVSDGPGWADAASAHAGIAIFAYNSLVGQGLIQDNRDFVQADADGVSSWRQAITLGAALQAVIVRIEGTLGPIDFAIEKGSVVEPIHTSDKVLSGSTWDYYYVGTAENETITVKRRANITHTRFHGELGGRALGQVETVEEKADAAQLEADTVIEAFPEFIVGQQHQRNIYLSIVQPINAYPGADTCQVSVGGAAVVRVAYDPGALHQVLTVGLTNSQMENLSDAIHASSLKDVQLDVRFQLGNGAQAGALKFLRNVFVPVAEISREPIELQDLTPHYLIKTALASKHVLSFYVHDRAVIAQAASARVYIGGISVHSQAWTGRTGEHVIEFELSTTEAGSIASRHSPLPGFFTGNNAQIRFYNSSNTEIHNVSFTIALLDGPVKPTPRVIAAFNWSRSAGEAVALPTDFRNWDAIRVVYGRSVDHQRVATAVIPISAVPNVSAKFGEQDEQLTLQWTPTNRTLDPHNQSRIAYLELV